MKVKRLIAAFVVAVLYLQPATVSASGYSPLTYLRRLHPPGIDQNLSGCGQAAVTDTAINYYQDVTKAYIYNSCAGANVNDLTGYMGTHLSGFRSGLFCGQSQWSYNNVTTSAWQMWQQLCDNPSGIQWFYTTGASAFWDLNGYWYYPPTVDSPVVSY